METQNINSTIIDSVHTQAEKVKQLFSEIKKEIVGQQHIVELIVNALLSGGHILLEGVPGIAKTTMVKAVAQSIGLDFKRVQFTPDLLPADLIGTLIYNQKTQDFETKKGPIFAHLILADEINRAPAKVQSALLEAMQEQQVTIGSNTYPLEQPFLVFATQNPIEQEGTYQLPEAQIDRFMFKGLVGYPTAADEKEIINKKNNPTPSTQVLTSQDILQLQELVKQIYIDEKIVDYIVRLVAATRESSRYQMKHVIKQGASPRATLSLHTAARAHAFLEGRHFVTPDDVKTIAHAVLRHRITRSFEAEADSISTDTIITQLLSKVPAP